MESLLDGIHLLIRILIWLIVIDAILTWIPSISSRHRLVQLLRKITRPVLEPFRQLVPPEKTGYIDLSPLLAIIVLTLIDQFIP